MKKTTLLTLLALAITSFSYSQTLKIIIQGVSGPILNDSVISVYGSNSSILISPTIDVINNGPKAYLHAKRTILSAVVNSTNAICFAGICGPVTDGTDPDSCNIATGDTAELGNAFYGDYYPNGGNGVTTIRYTFFNHNYTDTASFVVRYVSSPTGIAQISEGEISFLSPYPNPAGSFVNFNYSLNNGIQAANLKIYNLLGECVQTLPLSALKSKTSIDVQSMPSGIYVCELQADGCQPAYQKLIVSH